MKLSHFIKIRRFFKESSYFLHVLQPIRFLNPFILTFADIYLSIFVGISTIQ